MIKGIEGTHDFQRRRALFMAPAAFLIASCRRREVGEKLNNREQELQQAIFASGELLFAEGRLNEPSWDTKLTFTTATFLVPNSHDPHQITLRGLAGKSEFHKIDTYGLPIILLPDRNLRVNISPPFTSIVSFDLSPGLYAANPPEFIAGVLSKFNDSEQVLIIEPYKSDSGADFRATVANLNDDAFSNAILTHKSKWLTLPVGFDPY